MHISRHNNPFNSFALFLLQFLTVLSCFAYKTHCFFFFFYCSTTKMIYPSLCHYCMQFFSPPPHPPIVLSLFLTYCCTSLYYHLHTPSLGFYPNRFCSYSLSISFFLLHFLSIYITAVLVFYSLGQQVRKKFIRLWLSREPSPRPKNIEEYIEKWQSPLCLGYPQRKT